MLELLYTSPRKISNIWDNSKNLDRFVFNKAWDVMLLSGPAVGVYGTLKVFKDGHICRCMDEYRSPIFSMMEMAGGGLCTYTKGNISPYAYQLFELDPFTAMPVVTPFMTFNSTLSLFGRGWFIDQKRALIFKTDNNYLRVYSLANPPVLQWSLNLGEAFYAIHWVADGKIMLSKTHYTGGTHTAIIFVDYREQVVLLQTQLNPYRVVVFDSYCGVVFSINAAGYIEVYYPQAIPSHLTIPVLDPAGIGLYQGSFISTQILGDLNEPCPGRVVHWSLTNGLGALAKETTRSDDYGIASNYYFAPDDPTQVGLEETIRVETFI